MALIKVKTGGLTADSVNNTILDLTDDFAFTGTITGAGSEGLIHLETQETTTTVTNIKFGSDVFNSTYDRYYIVGRAMPDTDNAKLHFKLMDSSETDITTTNAHRWTLNGATNTASTEARILGSAGNVNAMETGVLFASDFWLRGVGSNNYFPLMKTTGVVVDTANSLGYHESTFLFRSDLDSTQPAGINYFFNTGNFSRAMISVFAVSEG